MEKDNQNPKQCGQIQTYQGDNEVATVGCRLLQTLDYQKREIPNELQKVANRPVRIPGFAVPLSDGISWVKMFLLVPNQMACIHVPAPPLNLIVLVELKEGRPINKLWGPLWVEGVLEIKKSNSTYGAVAYKMKADSVEPYTVPPRN